MNPGYQTASARIKWEAPGVTSRYLVTTAVKNNLSSLELPHALKPDQIENDLKSINEALHDAASVSDRTLRKSLKPKAYWCPELSRLRDRKRFWWSLWVANDRPRTGAVFSCYKGVKKLFRKLQRGKINEVIDEFVKFYSSIMTKDDSSLNNPQELIKDAVHARFRDFKGYAAHKTFSTDDIRKAISSMRNNVSPGIDGIQAKHLIHGNCDELVSHLAVSYNSMFSHTVMPDILSMGIIIPILKKPTLNPNKPDNYRPITLSSTHIKLIEILMMSSDKSCNSQYGFRQGRGTAMACSLINDLMLYCNARGSPMFICSFDAEKCFDSIWHDGLFYKLIEILPLSHWLFLYQLYGRLQATVKWDEGIGAYFRVTRGTKQGSILPLCNITYS